MCQIYLVIAYKLALYNILYIIHFPINIDIEKLQICSHHIPSGYVINLSTSLYEQLWNQYPTIMTVAASGTADVSQQQSRDCIFSGAGNFDMRPSWFTQQSTCIDNSLSTFTKCFHFNFPLYFYVELLYVNHYELHVVCACAYVTHGTATRGNECTL